MGHNLGKDFSKNKIETRFGGVNVEEWDRIAVHPKGGGHVGHPIPLCNKNYRSCMVHINVLHAISWSAMGFSFFLTENTSRFQNNFSCVTCNGR